MEETTTHLTIAYIKERPDVKSCLKKGLINYSSLARLISKDLDIEKKTSKEAILIAARRFRERLKEDVVQEKRIKDLLARSEIEIKNKIVVLVFSKSMNPDKIEALQQKVRKEAGTFYFLEGSDNYTLITQEKYLSTVENLNKQHIIKTSNNLALIMFKSPKEIEQVMGVISFLSSLFTEHGINIVELVSVWTDTLFVVNANDVTKTMEFLRF
ncbi:MAG TPA: hypothetical protein VJH22_05780 [Candidatus Nanoarchaeia archaeon]|nr:hypothetical protein [Candidatus Nanoarchaeia archaeon]